MNQMFRIVPLGLFALLMAGCGSAENETVPTQVGQQSSEETEKEHGHSHEGGDALVWTREKIEHKGFSITLGHHGHRVLAGRKVEPAVAILRDGTDIADAKVFNSLVSVDDDKVLAEEVATVYEPKTDAEPAHYAQGGLNVPEKLERVIIRYRILLPGDAGEVKFDESVTVD